MKLSELYSKLSYETDGSAVLVFDCPCGASHKLRIPVDRNATGRRTTPQVWKLEGNMPDISLTPSVDAGCWHGNIVKGEIQTVHEDRA